MKINISDLRKTSEILFDFLESSGLNSVELDSDFYWIITKKEQLFNPYKKPDDLGLGQLHDDYKCLENILDGTNEPINYSFVCLSSIFRFLGEKIISRTDS
jgi:hypothetical protein